MEPLEGGGPHQKEGWRFYSLQQPLRPSNGLSKDRGLKSSHPDLEERTGQHSEEGGTMGTAGGHSPHEKLALIPPALQRKRFLQQNFRTNREHGASFSKENK